MEEEGDGGADTICAGEGVQRGIVIKMEREKDYLIFSFPQVLASSITD